MILFITYILIVAALIIYCYCQIDINNISIDLTNDFYKRKFCKDCKFFNNKTSICNKHNDFAYGHNYACYIFENKNNYESRFFRNYIPFIFLI